MRTILIVAAAALLAVPAALGQTLPLSYVTNGDFEDGFAAWSFAGTGDLSGAGLISPGARGTDTAVLVREVGGGSVYLHQNAASLAAAPVAMLDLAAKVVANPHHPWTQGLTVLDGSGEVTVDIRFRENVVQLRLFCGGALYACDYHSFDYPLDGEWHDYQVVLTYATGLAVFLIDGEVVDTLQGNPGYVGAPARIHFGDLAWHIRGPAPDVAWDEIYFGPAT